MEFDKNKRDKYGRLLVYVYVNGKSVQEALLAAGLAEVVVYQPNDKYEDKYQAIEAKAKAAAKKGIWADDPCGKNGGTKPDDGKKYHGKSGEGNDNRNKGFSDNKGDSNQSSTLQQPKSGNSDGQTGAENCHSLSNLRPLWCRDLGCRSWTPSDSPASSLTYWDGVTPFLIFFPFM